MTSYNHLMAASREELLKVWDDAWSKGLWHALWSKALDDLTPQQAAWSPGPDRHSIWQIVDHMMFWREVAVRRATGRDCDPADDEIKARNFRPTPPPAPRMLQDLRDRFRASHEQVRDAIANPSSDASRLAMLPYHDSYHVGQLMQLRALQGLPPIE